MSDASFMAIAYVNLDEVDAAMSDAEERGRRLGPAFRELRKPMRADQTQHARGAEGSNGPWPARSPATEARRRLRNRRLRKPKALRLISPVKQLRRSTPKALLGRLPKALKITTGELWIRAMSRSHIGYAHNRGARVGHSHLVTLPPREFLWISDPFLERCAEVFSTHIVKGWNR